MLSILLGCEWLAVRRFREFGVGLSTSNLGSCSTGCALVRCQIRGGRSGSLTVLVKAPDFRINSASAAMCTKVDVSKTSNI